MVALGQEAWHKRTPEPEAIPRAEPQELFLIRSIDDRMDEMRLRAQCQRPRPAPKPAAKNFCR